MKIIKLKPRGETIVDDDDYEFLKHFNWRISLEGYAYYSSRSIRVYMHRMIMEPCKPFWVDHINHNRLYNRKENLRLVLPIENSWNRFVPNKSSKYFGVSYIKQYGTWTAYMSTRSGVVKRLGAYKTEVEASCAYDIASKEHWGEVARLNFPNGVPIKNPVRNRKKKRIKICPHCKKVI